MGSFDFTNFKEEEKNQALIPSTVLTGEIVSDAIPTVLDVPSQKSVLSNQLWQTAGQTAMAAVCPEVMIVNSVLKCIGDIANSVALIKAEEAKTEQVRLGTNAAMFESQQKTERLRVSETENTTRVIAECECKIQQDKNELEKIRIQFAAQSNQNLLTHEERKRALDAIESIIKTQLELYSMNNSVLLSMLENNVNTQIVNSMISRIDNTEKSLQNSLNQLASLVAGVGK